MSPSTRRAQCLSVVRMLAQQCCSKTTQRLHMCVWQVLMMAQREPGIVGKPKSHTLLGMQPADGVLLFWTGHTLALPFKS